MLAGLVCFCRSGPLHAAAQTPGESPIAGHASAGMSGIPKAVVLILVGPPGAGKSTFAEELMRRAFGQWHRINQVKNGIHRCGPFIAWQAVSISHGSHEQIDKSCQMFLRMAVAVNTWRVP